jgi:cholesterol transport system auxiliary component
MRPWLLGFAALLLGGCAVATRNAPPAVVYDFGPPVARVSASGAWQGLVVAVRSPPWFDSLNVDYRLAYDDPLVLREYAGSRWAGSPGVLLAQRLAQQLGTVGDGSAGGSSACLLRVDLHEFAQRFDTPRSSAGVVQGSVSLFDARRRLLAERRIAVEQPATRTDAQGGATALMLASNEVGRQLAAWLDALEKNDAAASRCRAVGRGG